MKSIKYPKFVTKYVARHVIIRETMSLGRPGYEALSPILHVKIGMILYQGPFNNALELYSFQVLERYQQNGIGRKLLSCVVNLALQEGMSQIYVAPAPCTDLKKKNEHCCTTDILEKIYEKYGFEKRHDDKQTSGPKFYFLNSEKFSYFETKPLFEHIHNVEK